MNTTQLLGSCLVDASAVVANTLKKTIQRETGPTVDFGHANARKTPKIFLLMPLPGMVRPSRPPADDHRYSSKYYGHLGCEFSKHGLKQLCIWENNDLRGKEGTSREIQQI